MVNKNLNDFEKDCKTIIILVIRKTSKLFLYATSLVEALKAKILIVQLF